MSPHSIALIASFIVAIAFVLLIDRLLRPSLRTLLEQTTVLPAATEFYLRSFLIVLAFASVSSVLGAGHSDLKDGAHFMEYVWSVASSMQEVFQSLFIILLVYVVLITILIATLGRNFERRS